MKVIPFKRPLHYIVEAQINPSEAEEKLSFAIRRLFPSLEVRREGRWLRGEGEGEEGLHYIYEQIRRRQTAGVVKRILKSNREGEELWLYLNRQAAYVGVFVVCEEAQESPLGPIRLLIRTPDPEGFIEWLTA